MSRSFANPSSPNANSRSFSAAASTTNPCVFGGRVAASRITALNIEFVAKPSEAHKVQSALPAAIHGAFGEIAGFAGGFVLIANYEARLVTIVTLWTGEDRLQRCSENLRWLRALLNPYMDRCLRIQTLAAYVPVAKTVVKEFEPVEAATLPEIAESEEHAIYAA